MDERGYVTAEEVRAALGALYREDREANPARALAELLGEGPAPAGARRRGRARRLLLILLLTLAAVAAIFAGLSSLSTGGGL